jgi:hypothetical protein
MRKFFAPEFVFGAGAGRLAGQYAANFGAERALVVSDPGVIRAGWVDPVLETLKEFGIDPILYDEISENPRAEEVDRGAEIFARSRCFIVVAVGGGSPLDCAKGISLLSSNGGDIRDYEGVDRVPIPGAPLIMLPTTAGSAAEVSQFAIIKIHPEAGFEILKGIRFRGPVARAVLQHHERLDGSGYPGGLREEEILLEARILAVADIVEAMAYHRPYRPALGVPAAMEEILSLKERGRLCPEAVEACRSLFEGGADPMNDEDERTGGAYP